MWTDICCLGVSTHGIFQDLSNAHMNSKFEILGFGLPNGLSLLSLACRIYLHIYILKWMLCVLEQRDRQEIVHSMINGYDVNQANSKGQTALHIAAQAGHRNVLCVLIAFKANVEAVDKEDKTAFDVASTDECREELLLVRQRDWTPLMMASKRGGADGVLSLLNDSVSSSTHETLIDAINDMKETALLIAIKNDNVPAVKELLRWKASPEAADKSEKNCIHHAMSVQ